MKIGDKVKIIRATGSYTRFNGKEGILGDIKPEQQYSYEVTIIGEGTRGFKLNEIELVESKTYIQYGMKAHVIYNDGTETTYRNLTEVHYNPPPSFEIVAFESDIHGTGYTIEKSKIRDIEITLETEIAKSI